MVLFEKTYYESAIELENRFWSIENHLNKINTYAKPQSPFTSNPQTNHAIIL